MEFFADVGAEVVTGGEYVSGGKILSGKTLGYTAGTNVIKFAASNVTWAASTITASYAVIYKNSGNPATSPLMGFVDFGAVYSSSAGDFTITWDAGGILTVTSA
jgi:hypothetical protein